MRTSGVYNNNISVDTVVTIAGQKAGIEPPMMDGQYTKTCFFLLNNIFSDWVNDGVNLWTRRRFAQSLVAGQAYYQLQERIVDIMEMTTASLTRVFGSSAGVAFSLNGVAQNAFDGNTATVCTCTASGGNNADIGFNFNQNNPQAIKYIGIQSATNSTYTLSVQYSNDNVFWIDAITDDVGVYYAGQVQWLCNQVPLTAQYWRVVETTGQTLSLQELYFSVDNISRLMGQVSNGDYEAYANKVQTGTPSSYTLYRLNYPTIAVYPTPDLSTYQYLVYTAQVYIEKVTDLYQLLDLPQRYHAATINELAYQLSVIYKPEKAPLLKNDADMSYMAARNEDSEKVPLQINFEWVR